MEGGQSPEEEISATSKKISKPETPSQNSRKLDALVVPGKGLHWDESKRAKQPLTPRSRLNVLAAGQLYQQGAAENIILSGGKTKGSNGPSEAEAMKAYLNKKYPNIPEERIVTETESIDTAQNAEKARAELERLNAKRVGLVTTRDHLKNSRTLFENYGVGVTKSYASEDIVRDTSPHHRRFVDRYFRAPRRLYERSREGARRAGLWLDRRGGFVRRFTSRRSK